MKKEKIAGWSLTHMCNLACMHCYNDSGKRRNDELSADEALKVIDKLAQSNVAAVNFGGGECALRPDFLDLCAALVEKDIKISYTTNGTIFPLFESGLDLFHDIGVSIDFADAKNHDLFRGMKGTFNKAVKCIDQLVQNNVNTEIVTCLTKLNSSEVELEKIYNFAQEHQVNFWRLNRYRATGRAVYNDDFLRIAQPRLKTAFDFLNSKRDLDSPVSEPMFRAVYGGTYHVPGDPSGKYSFRIQSNGEVSPSVFLSTSGGNIKDKSLEEIFDSEVFQQIRNRTPQGKCNSCQEYYHCQGGDAGVSYLLSGHFNGPDGLCYKDTSLPKNQNVSKIITSSTNVHETYLCTLYIPIKK